MRKVWLPTVTFAVAVVRRTKCFIKRSFGALKTHFNDPSDEDYEDNFNELCSKFRALCWPNSFVPSNMDILSKRQYRYRDLENEGDIRLLQILYSGRKVMFQIIHRQLDEETSFEAVSYVWGDQSQPHTLIMDNNTIFFLTNSLADALPFTAVRFKTGYLWIDQICVNRAGIQERNQEVPRMGTIFELSTDFMAWLRKGNIWSKPDFALNRQQTLKSALS